MPPTRGAALGSGKKTLSDSEVLAYNRNRHAERSLTTTMRRLSDQEQHAQDRHQREILQWRDFRRRSSKTSGMWCTSWDTDDLTEDCFLPEEGTDWVQERGDPENSGESGGGWGPALNSPRSNSQRGSGLGLSSSDLARSLTFQSEALSTLKKPWAYTYSVTSYNSVYNEAVQAAEGQKKRLNFRRASSVSSANLSSPDQPPARSMFRSRSSAGDVGLDLLQGASRPLTGRSTPGILQGSPHARHRLSLSAAVDRPRVSTSLSVVQGCGGQDMCEDRDIPPHPLSLRDQTSARSEGRLPCVVSAQRDDRTCAPQRDVNVPDTLPKVTLTAPDSEADELRQPGSGSPEGNTVYAGENARNELGQHTKFNINLSISKENSETDMGDGPQLASETNADFQEPVLSEGADNKTATDRDVTDVTRMDQPASPSSPAPPRSRDRKVHIQLTPTAAQVDRSRREIDDQSITAEVRSPPKDKEIALPTARVKRDEKASPLAAKTAEANTATLSPPTPRRPTTRAGSGDNRRHKSVNYDHSTRRRSDIGGIPQRPDVTSEVSRSERRGSGALSRRYSAIDVSRPGSFMKIVDQLEALREVSHHRMNCTDDDKEDWLAENQVSGSAKQVTDDMTRLSGTEVCVKEQSPRARTGARGVGKAGQNSGEHAQNTNGDSIPLSRSSTSHNTKDQSLQTKTSDCNKTSDNTPPPSSEQRRSSGDIQAVKTPPSGTPLLRHSSSDVTVFKGFKLRNYVPPQQRYRAHVLGSPRGEKPLPRLSTDGGAWPRKQSDTKPVIIFSKTSRQKVLQELVQRHNRPFKPPDSGVLTPQLRAKIDAFFKTIEPYCPKPDLLLD